MANSLWKPALAAYLFIGFNFGLGSTKWLEQTKKPIPLGVGFTLVAFSSFAWPAQLVYMQGVQFGTLNGR